MPLDLFIKYTSSGAPSEVMFRRALPKPRKLRKPRNLVDYGTWIIFAVLMSDFKWPKGPFRHTRLNYDVWMEIFGWLLVNKDFRLFLPMTAAGKMNISNREFLEKFALPIRNMQSRASVSSLFSRHHLQYEIAYLLDAILNADHRTVQKIVRSEDPSRLKKLLTFSGTAVIEHLGLTRVGTALQMAFYRYDERLFKLLTQFMDKEDVITQCRKIFKTYGVHNWDEFILKQKEMAEKYCDIENEICQQIRLVTKNTKGNSFSLPAEKLTDLENAAWKSLKPKLKKYIEKYPVYNPFLIQHPLLIFLCKPCYPPENALCMKAIVFLKRISFPWLAEHPQGIQNLAASSSEESFTPFLFSDMRSFQLSIEKKNSKFSELLQDAAFVNDPKSCGCLIS